VTSVLKYIGLGWCWFPFLWPSARHQPKLKDYRHGTSVRPKYTARCNRQQS